MAIKMTIIVFSFFIIGGIGSYFFLKYLFQNNATKLFRLMLILFPICLVIAVGGWYVMDNSVPTSFRSGVDLIVNNNTLINKVGLYESYSYMDKNLPKESDNPAKFNIEINGSKAVLYLTCKMAKNSLGKWSMTELKQDSLKLRVP